MRAIWPEEVREPTEKIGGAELWQSFGRGVPKVTPRMRGYLRRDLQAREDEEQPTGFWYKNEEQFGVYSDVAAALVNMLTARGRTVRQPGLLAAEWDQLKKFVIWRTRQNGWWCIPEGLASQIDNGDEAEWAKASDVIMRTYMKHADKSNLLQNAVAMNRVPATTHKGWPTHGSGPDVDEMSAHATIGMAVRHGVLSFDRAVDKMKSISGVEYGPVATAFSRVQGNAKWITTYRSTAGGWMTPTEETRFRYPRTRTVWGVPNWMNAVIRENMGMMKGLIRSVPHHNPNPDAAQEFIHSFFVDDNDVFSEDISGYDQSVGAMLMRLYNRTTQRVALYVEPSFYTVGVGRTLDALVTLPVLAPRMSESDEGYIYDRNGRIISGSSDTSTRGTWINTCRAWMCARYASGLSWEQLAEAWERGVWKYAIWGDDTVVSIPKAWRDKWTLRSNQLGFETTFVPGAVFLMRYYSPEGGPAYGLATRAYLNTINKEERLEPTRMDVAMLGLKQRHVMVRNSPFFDVVDWAFQAGRPELKDAWLKAKASKLIDLERAVAENGDLSTREALALEQDGVKSPILSAAVDEALRRGHAYYNLLTEDHVDEADVGRALEVMDERAHVQGRVAA